MTKPKFSPSRKAAIVKKFKSRQASKAEAINNSIAKGLSMPQVQIVITISAQAINVDSGNIPLPLVIANLEIAKALTMNRMIGVKQATEPEVIAAPASALDQFALPGNGRG